MRAVEPREPGARHHHGSDQRHHCFPSPFSQYYPEEPETPRRLGGSGTRPRIENYDDAYENPFAPRFSSGHGRDYRHDEDDDEDEEEGSRLDYGWDEGEEDDDWAPRRRCEGRRAQETQGLFGPFGNNHR
ncbi:hypothetical protein IMSHALPRED_003454 [Imshaugia aleurites]|uniref:Uncharacterized protein n=1 Tax=Imshaugia aleurites TaxID=172621 RepID=A0A8H3J7Z1_9LECA|nr:hypothetical protein IMSHALPRED_003454 [Imshaugia aleurites]